MRMVGVFRVGLQYISAPKDLGLNVGIYGTVFEQSRLDLWIFFGWSEAEILCLFWTVLRLIIGLLISPCVMFLVLLLKMNNMLVVCELC